MQTPDSRSGLRLSGISVYPDGLALDKDPSLPGLHLAIGMFDGVHTGHQTVIKGAIMASGKDSGSRSAVLTFDPHPSRVLHPQKATDLLMPLRARIEHMLAMGLDHVFVQEFTHDYARMQASEFVPNLKKLFPGLMSLHVGENFRFGAGRSGSVDTLKISAREAGLETYVVERKMDSGEPVSSSRIRSDLAMGKMEQVNTMLGYPYTISGEVVEGRKIGRTMGFPTLNIQWNPEALPRYGVYKAWVLSAPSNRPVPAVANYGLRPTVSGGEDPLLEVHLLDSGPVPGTGSFIEVALETFIRPEKAFSSLEDLREQISRDVRQARELPDKGMDFSLCGA